MERESERERERDFYLKKRVWLAMSSTNVKNLGFKNTPENSHLRVGAIDLDNQMSRNSNPDRMS